MADEKKIGVITEQGDLGLGFTELNEADATAYANAPKREENPPKETNDNK